MLENSIEPSFIAYKAKKSILAKHKVGERRHSVINLQNMSNSPKNNLQTLKKSETNQNIIPSVMKEIKNQNKEEVFLEIFKFKKKNKNENIVNQSINRSRNNMLNLEENNPNINNLKINKLHEQKGPLKSSINLNVFKEKRDTDKDSDSLINFNIFDYYCLIKINKKKT